MNKSRRRGTAYHEAGHAVAIILQGLPITAVSMRRNGDARGECSHPSPLMIDCPARERRGVARAFIVAMYAGIEAEHLLDPAASERSAKWDFDQAFQVSRDYEVLPRRINFIGDDSHHEFLARLRVEARKLVRQSARQIRDVAEALMEQRSMDCASVQRVMQVDTGSPGEVDPVHSPEGARSER